MAGPFHMRVIDIIRQIPEGRVITYGLVALHAGNGRAARQVGRILATCSGKENLPWHRVVNRAGRISVPEAESYLAQRNLLHREGVAFDPDDKIDLAAHLWQPE